MNAMKALRRRYGYAYDRNTFKDKVEEHLTGARGEFYKAALAKKNRQTDWVQHWESEVWQLLNRSLYAAIVHDVRGCRNKRLAVDQVVASMQTRDDRAQRHAIAIVERDYKMRVRKFLDGDDTRAFWVLAKEAIDQAFIGEPIPKKNAQPRGKRRA
jgi:hypothetical protein